MPSGVAPDGSLIIRRFGDRHRVAFETGDDTLVQQNLAEETDINRIVAKYQKTGVFTHVSRYAGEYGDFSGVPDYKTGLERIQAADEMFMSLPSKIRDRFGNDPAKFIEFATDEKNLDELQKMGLAPKKAQAEAERPKLEAKAEADPPKEAPKP